MALDDYALCEIDDVRTDMNFKEGEHTDKDPIIESLINAYSPIIENYLNTYAINRNLTEEYDGDGTDILLLNYCPVVSITSLKIDDIAISADNYYLYKKLGKIVLDSDTFDKGNQNVEVQYKVGYGESLEDIPFPIRQACASLVHFYVKRHNIDFSETFSEGFVIKYPISRLPDFIKEFLDPYRKILI